MRSLAISDRIAVDHVDLARVDHSPRVGLTKMNRVIHIVAVTSAMRLGIPSAVLTKLRLLGLTPEAPPLPRLGTPGALFGRRSKPAWIGCAGRASSAELCPLFRTMTSTLSIPDGALLRLVSRSR